LAEVAWRYRQRAHVQRGLGDEHHQQQEHEGQAGIEGTQHPAAVGLGCGMVRGVHCPCMAPAPKRINRADKKRWAREGAPKDCSPCRERETGNKQNTGPCQGRPEKPGRAGWPGLRGEAQAGRDYGPNVVTSAVNVPSSRREARIWTSWAAYWRRSR